MSVDVRPEIRIDRPRSAGAAYMFDPRHGLSWTGGITASTPSGPGPLTEGMTVERTARFLGRRCTYGYRVTGHEPDRLVEMRVERPFPMVVRYELEDADGGSATLVAIHATGSPRRVFGWGGPLMRRQVQRSIAADLRRLREHLEATSARHDG